MGFDILHELLGDGIERQALSGIVAQALLNQDPVLLQHPGIHPVPNQIGRDQPAADRIPVRQQQRFAADLVFGTGIYFPNPMPDDPGFPPEVVAEGSYGRFDPGFVTHAGIVLVQLQDQVGFPGPFQDLLEVVGHEGIRRAFKGSDQHGVDPFPGSDCFGGLQDGGRVIPVKGPQQPADLLSPIRGPGQHILGEGLDSQGPEDIGDPLVHDPGEEGIGAAQ